MNALQGIILGAVLALFAALGVTIFIQHERLNAAAAQEGRLTQENAALHAENDRWKILAGRQNEKFAALAALEKQKQAAAAKAEKITDVKNAPLLALAARIDARPAAAGDDCAAALVFKNLYFTQRQ